ncbi:MAG: AraC family transcriptional regulator [Bacteroidota bacterium]
MRGNFLYQAEDPLSVQERQQTQFKIFEHFDQTELLEAHHYQQDFPVHFHDRICITLVTEGYECTEVDGQRFMAPLGSISLTHADEAHANPNLNEQAYSFLTFYVSPDVIRHISSLKRFRFKSRVVQDPTLFEMFYQMAKLPDVGEQAFIQAIDYLAEEYIGPEQANQDFSIPQWNLPEVLAYIQEKMDDRIRLEQLALIADCSSYQFIRWFKKAKGITPGQYITIKRVEAAKRLLKGGNTAVDAALSVGFYDQSHFTHAFRKLCGLTPSAYRKQMS